MKIHPKANGGNVLFGTLFVTGIICLFMGSYLALVRSENKITRRSMAWNMAIPIAEAGIEEALTELKFTFPNIKETTGWTNANSGNASAPYLVKRRDLSSNEFYKVVILPPSLTNGPTPIIVSEGFVRISGTTNFVSRTVRVRTKLDGYFMPGMVVVSNAVLSGGVSMTVDSYNSTNSTFSTGGKYDEKKRGDKAYLATLSSKANAIDLGNTQVWGKVASAPNGAPPKLGSQSSVGNKQWHDDGNKGLQKGAYTDDVNISVEPIDLPFTSGSAPPTAGSGVYQIGTGDYAIDNLSGTVYVTGKARLLVTKTFDVKSLTISNATGTASLELYVAAQNVDISGNGQLNVQGRPSNFKYFGLPENKALNWTGNKTLKAGGNGQLNAMIYAPYTALTLAGGGNDVQDFSGAAMIGSVLMNGHYSFHYDESTATEMARQYVAISWDEQKVTYQQIIDGKLTAQQLINWE